LRRQSKFEFERGFACRERGVRGLGRPWVHQSRASVRRARITFAGQSAAGPSTPRRRAASRRVEIVGGACAYDLLTPASADGVGRRLIDTLRARTNRPPWWRAGCWSLPGAGALSLGVTRLIDCLGFYPLPRVVSRDDVNPAEVSLGQQSIMRCAEQSQILCRRRAATCPGMLVMDL
jgi:hypothetical protein